MSLKKLILMASVALLGGCASSMHAGSRIEYDELTQIVDRTQGLHMEAVPVNPVGMEDAPPAYEFVVPEAAPGEPFLLFVSNAINSSICWGKASVNEEQQLVQEEGRVATHILGGFSPGEKVEYYFVSEDMQRGTMVKLIPQPLDVDVSGECTAQAEAFLVLGYLFHIEASGFELGEAVEVEISTADQPVDPFTLVAAPPDGSVFILYEALRDGAKGGLDVIRLRGRSGSVSVRIPWGSTYKQRAEEILESEFEALRRERVSAL